MLRRIYPKTLIYVMNVLVISALVFVSLSLITNLSSAQQPRAARGLETSPPSQEISANPGDVVVVKSKVTNKSNEVSQIKVRIEDFTAQGEYGQIALIDKGEQSLTQWSKLDLESLTLNPGESKEVTASIKIPTTAAGGHYGSFVFSVSEGQPNPNTAVLSQEIASLFLLKLSGDVTEKVVIEEFTAPKFVEFGPVSFNLKFKNEGNIHVKPYGLINITDMFGKTVKDLVFQGQNVLPNSTRIVNQTFDQKLLFGPYKVQAVLYYGSKNESLYEKTSFFAFPTKLAIVILIVILILFKLRKRIIKAVRELVK